MLIIHEHHRISNSAQSIMDVIELYLAVPFLSAGDLPVLAAVSKGAKELARAEFQKRSKSDNRRQLEVLDEGVKKQEIGVHDITSIPPPWYRKFDHPCKRWQNAPLEERDGQWYIKIGEEEYHFPSDQLDPTDTTIKHCSRVEDTIVVIANVDVGAAENGWHNACSLWSILYRTTTTGGESDWHSNIEPVAVQELVNNMQDSLAEANSFGEAFRSGNGKSLVVITEMGGYEEQVETCTLTVYKVTQSRLDNVQNILVDWCDEEYGEVDASLSTCGQLLSVRSTWSQDEPVTWALYDLRSTPAKVLFEKYVSSDDYFTVEHIFFTIDNEIVVELDPEYVSAGNDAAHKGSPMAQYVEKFFSFLKDIPAFAKRVVIQYSQDRTS